jgi:hypothetical protein
MFSFFKKKNNKPNQIPVWADFFTDEEYLKFDEELNRYLRTLNIPYTINDGRVEVNEDIFGVTKLGLTNVAQVCKQTSFKNYYKAISDHFETMIRAHKFDKEFQGIEHNYELVKEYICVRVYDHKYVEHIGRNNTLGKDIAGDLYAMIVFDLPHTIVSITPEKAKKWNQPFEALFNTGIDNVSKKYSLSISEQHFREFKIWLVECNHFFAGHIIFELPHKKELVGTNGSLVAIPHRHAAIIYPIESLEVFKAINTLIPVIYGMNQEGPGSLSNNLFWYADGTFTNLPYIIEDQKIQFMPPENFVTMMSSLK